MKKRKLAALVALTLALTSLSGCGSASSTSSNSITLEGSCEYVGYVTAATGSTFSVQLGVLTENSTSMSGGMEMSDMGDMQMDMSDMETMEMPSDAGEGGDMEMPSDAGEGDMDMSDMSEMSASTQSLTLSDVYISLCIIDDGVLSGCSLDEITVGTVLNITTNENGDIASVSILSGVSVAGSSASTGSSNGITYSALNEITSDTTIDGETISSTGTDENAILITDGATVTITDITLDRTSSDSTGGDNSSFYGVGAAILNYSGTAYISGATITTDAAGGAGIFSYGDAITYVANCIISTVQNTSGGIHAAGGGTLYAWNCTVETNGESAAAIRSDRGGGTMVVEGGTYTSNGTGSPAVYCTADITIADATLTATGSEAVCIEGLNTLRLFDCDLSGNMSDDDQNDCTWTIILYQSMSGDSEVGNSEFDMVGGSITSNNGGLFYTTNTESTFYISGVDITYSSSNDYFLQVTGNANERGWGSTGSNGSQCTFTADAQEMAGAIIYDSISTLDFYMLNGSTLTGYFVDDETWAGNGGSGYCNVYISADSTWIVTADSTVTALYNAGTITDAEGNTVTIVGTDGTVYVQGTSAYTITVESYGTEVDTSGATSAPSYSDYQVTKPEQLG